MLTVTTITDRDHWNDTLRPLPQAHVLQTWEWGAFKQATTGWQPLRLAFWREDDLAALASVGVRRAGPFTVMYAPKGPVFAADDPDAAAAVLAHLEQMARRRGAVWLKLDPDIVAATGVPGEPDDIPCLPGQRFTQMLQARGWRFSADQVQFRNTIVLDLAPDEDTLLAQMSQNTRRKIRTAEKKGVSVRPGTPADLDTLYALYAATARRDSFLIRPLDYYRRAWQSFMEAGLAHALIAEVEGAPVAHVILFHFGRTCWYFYGASANEHRDRMPNYLLQWEALRWARAQGCARYDLWGAPDVFDESDSMWGVYEFKRGFRGTVTRHIGAWDYAPYTLLYQAYTQAWPRALAWMKRRRA
jgi:lipid II:glycine glycyltransferase (peptidoglycan interpeptide bridge formation enzyme)